MSQLRQLLFAVFLLCTISFTTRVYSFDPSKVDPQTKATWCNDQTSTCVGICRDSGSGDPTTNTCDPVTLDYNCICGNGQTPNTTEYTQTIPYFTCTADQQDCIGKCAPANTPECIGKCTEKKCAATVIKNPAKSPGSVGGNTPTTTPATPGSTPPSSSPNPGAILNSAVMTRPFEGCFMLLFTLVIVLLLPA